MDSCSLVTAFASAVTAFASAVTQLANGVTAFARRLAAGRIIVPSSPDETAV